MYSCSLLYNAFNEKIDCEHKTTRMPLIFGYGERYDRYDADFELGSWHIGSIWQTEDGNGTTLRCVVTGEWN